MRVPLAKRLTITLFNIFFPPLAVALLTGFTSKDTLLNACLFLLAIIPSHIHGFYISAVYFTRKRRVRKGKWPGKTHKAGVWSEKVLTGGVGWEGARALRREERKSGIGGMEEEMGNGDTSDFDNGVARRESRKKRRSTSQRRSQRVSGTGTEVGTGTGNGTGYGDAYRRRSRMESFRPQSGGQDVNTPLEQVYTQPPMQEAGRVVSSGTQRSRHSGRL